MILPLLLFILLSAGIPINEANRHNRNFFGFVQQNQPSNGFQMIGGLAQIQKVVPFGTVNIITTTTTTTSNASAAANATNINTRFVVNTNLFFVPKRGYVKVKNFGCSFDDSGNFYEVYLNRRGVAYSFTASGRRMKIFGDSNGLPAGLGRDHRLYVGFVIINSIPTPSDPNGPWFFGTYDLAIISFLEFKTFPTFKRGRKLIPGKLCAEESQSGLIVFEGYILKGINWRRVNFRKAIGLGLVTEGLAIKVPAGFVWVVYYGVTIGPSKKWYAVYCDKDSVSGTIDENGKMIKVKWDSDGLPVAINNGKTWPGYRERNGQYIYSTGRGKLHSAKSDLISIAIKNTNRLGVRFPGYYLIHPDKFAGSELNLANSDGSGASDSSEEMGGNDVMVPLIGVGINFQRIKNKNDFFGMGLIRAGLNVEIKSDFIMVPKIGVKLKGRYFPVYVSSKDNLTYTVDEDGSVIPVLLDADNIPLILTKDNGYIVGYRDFDGVLKNASTTGQISQKPLNIDVIIAEINKLGSRFYGYWTINPYDEKLDTQNAERFMAGVPHGSNNIEPTDSITNPSNVNNPALAGINIPGGQGQTTFGGNLPDMQGGIIGGSNTPNGNVAGSNLLGPNTPNGNSVSNPFGIKNNDVSNNPFGDKNPTGGDSNNPFGVKNPNAGGSNNPFGVKNPNAGGLKNPFASNLFGSKTPNENSGLFGSKSPNEGGNAISNSIATSSDNSPEQNNDLFGSNNLNGQPNLNIGNNNPFGHKNEDNNGNGGNAISNSIATSSDKPGSENPFDILGFGKRKDSPNSKNPFDFGKRKDGPDSKNPFDFGKRKDGPDSKNPFDFGKRKDGPDSNNPFDFGKRKNGSDSNNPFGLKDNNKFGSKNPFDFGKRKDGPDLNNPFGLKDNNKPGSKNPFDFGGKKDGPDSNNPFGLKDNNKPGSKNPFDFGGKKDSPDSNNPFGLKDNNKPGSKNPFDFGSKKDGKSDENLDNIFGKKEDGKKDEIPSPFVSSDILDLMKNKGDSSGSNNNSPGSNNKGSDSNNPFGNNNNGPDSNDPFNIVSKNDGDKPDNNGSDNKKDQTSSEEFNTIFGKDDQKPNKVSFDKETKDDIDNLFGFDTSDKTKPVTPFDILNNNDDKNGNTDSAEKKKSEDSNKKSKEIVESNNKPKTKDSEEDIFNFLKNPKANENNDLFAKGTTGKPKTSNGNNQGIAKSNENDQGNANSNENGQGKPRASDGLDSMKDKSNVNNDQGEIDSEDANIDINVENNNDDEIFDFMKNNNHKGKKGSPENNPIDGIMIGDSENIPKSSLDIFAKPNDEVTIEKNQIKDVTIKPVENDQIFVKPTETKVIDIDNAGKKVQKSLTESEVQTLDRNTQEALRMNSPPAIARLLLGMDEDAGAMTPKQVNSSEIDLTEFDWSTVQGMGKINRGIKQAHLKMKMLMVPNYAVRLDDTNNYYPCYMNFSGFIFTLNDEGERFDVWKDGEEAPYVIINMIIYNGYFEQNGKMIMAHGTMQYNCYSLDFESVISTILKLGKHHPAYYILQCNLIIIQRVIRTLALAGSIEIPFGYVPISGMFVKTSANNTFYPIIINKDGRPSAYSDDKKLISVLFDSKGFPVVVCGNHIYTGLMDIDGIKTYGSAIKPFTEKIFDYAKYNIEPEEEGSITIPEGFYPLEGYLVSTSSDRQFYPVLIETCTNKAYTFDADGKKYEVFADSNNLPVVKVDGKVYPGLKEQKGSPIFSKTDDVLQQLKVDKQTTK